MVRAYDKIFVMKYCKLIYVKGLYCCFLHKISEHQGAVVLYLLQLLIGTGQTRKRKKAEPLEAEQKYKPVDIRDSFIYRVEVSSKFQLTCL